MYTCYAHTVFKYLKHDTSLRLNFGATLLEYFYRPLDIYFLEFCVHFSQFLYNMLIWRPKGPEFFHFTCKIVSDVQCQVCFFRCTYSVLMFFCCCSVALPDVLPDGVHVSVKMFLYIWCVFVFSWRCIHTDLSPEWTSPKLNPTVWLRCAFMKGGVYFRSSRLTTPKANMCAGISSNDLGGLKHYCHASLPESSLSLLPLKTLVSFKPIFLSSEKLIKKKEQQKSHK